MDKVRTLDEGDATRRQAAARRLIDEVHRLLLDNHDKIETSLNYGKIVYRRTASGHLDVQFSTKLEKPES